MAGYREASQKVNRNMNIKFKKSDGTVVLGQVTLQDEADIEDYERERAEKKLLVKLQEEAVKEEKEWLDLNELKALMEE